MIWSHCLAGTWLGGYWPGAERWDRLTILIVGVSGCFAAGAYLQERWRHGVRVGFAWMIAWPVLLYPLANAVSSQPVLRAATGEGILIAAYIFGSSVLARGGPAPGDRSPRWPWLLVILPVVVNATLSARFGSARLIVLVLPLFWLARVGLGRTIPLGLSRGAALRVGATLIDLSAVVACAAFLPWPGWFAILFALAMLCERFAQEP